MLNNKTLILALMIERLQTNMIYMNIVIKLSMLNTLKIQFLLCE